MLVLLSINSICHAALQHAYATCLLSGFFEEKKNNNNNKNCTVWIYDIGTIIILYNNIILADTLIEVSNHT